MKWLIDIFTNPFLITGLSSWIIAQILKMIISSIINKRFDIKRIWGDGGMPSGHSATVTSLAVFSGLSIGFKTFQFALAAILAIIVCHDAMGVRRETGKQTLLIKELVKSFEILSTEKLPEVKLKEFVGHTPVQVGAGILLGITNALLMYHVVL